MTNPIPTQGPASEKIDSPSSETGDFIIDMNIDSRATTVKDRPAECGMNEILLTYFSHKRREHYATYHRKGIKSSEIENCEQRD